MIPMSEQLQAILGNFGPLSTGMAGHILLMNLAAPMGAVWGVHSFPLVARPICGVAMPAAAQLLLLWAWHAPPFLAAAMDHPALHFGMQASLMAAALWFWTAVVSATAGRQWRAITALLATSKLFCLLGVLLTFAPHPLYPAMAHHGVMAVDPLADQQLAGLMMLVACPLTYLAAAVMVASSWLLSADQIERQPEGARIA
jgi:putative membrane protein